MGDAERVILSRADGEGPRTGTTGFLTIKTPHCNERLVAVND